MSAESLRHGARQRIEAHIDDVVQELVHRTGDTEAQMRLLQGRIMGLREALELLNEAYKRLS